MPRIIFTVTNDLSYDQRMHRIAGAMAETGYAVLLVGRSLPGSIPLKAEPYQQDRLTCFFNRKAAFYIEYNLRLFIFLLFRHADIVCAIDLDTILPVYFSSLLKRTRRVYDAHELFTEQQEIISRPGLQKVWLAIERFAVPRFPAGYTLNKFIAEEFFRRYGVTYQVIRNLPVIYPICPGFAKHKKRIIYQGAVNEGRCFETLIPAMKKVDAELLICGSGNFLKQTRQLILDEGLTGKVTMCGQLDPSELRLRTQQAYIGITLFAAAGLNQYRSLANRFFDYIMAGIPQVCVNYPEYASLNVEYDVALMINDTSVDSIALALNNLLTNDVLHNTLSAHCILAREVLNWEHEKQVLLNFYQEHL